MTGGSRVTDDGGTPQGRARDGLDGCDLINQYKKRFLESLFFRVDFYVMRIGAKEAVV